MKQSRRFRDALEQLKGKRDHLVDKIAEMESKIHDGKKLLRAQEKAREVIRQVGLKTQQQLSYNVSEIASLALDGILENPYKLDLDFVERRNKTECDISLTRGDLKIDPYDGGGGAIDVASFALRVASWSMAMPKTRNVLILDEPFKHLKGEETNRRMLEMVKELSDKLGIQIIMVSDERVSREATMAATDKLFVSKIRRGKTKINMT